MNALTERAEEARAAVLTVDDDPAVSRSVARDLRRRYGDWLDGVVARAARGFVVTGPDLSPGGERPRGWPLDRVPYYLETSVPGVFVAGDARAESAKRVASAFGEGAMAVMLVHRYLEKP